MVQAQSVGVVSLEGWISTINTLGYAVEVCAVSLRRRTILILNQSVVLVVGGSWPGLGEQTDRGHSIGIMCEARRRAKRVFSPYVFYVRAVRTDGARGESNFQDPLRQGRTTVFPAESPQANQHYLFILLSIFICASIYNAISSSC